MITSFLKTRNKEVAIFFIAFTVRVLAFLFLLWWYPGFPIAGSDSLSYLSAMESLSRDGRFLSPTGEPNSYEMPGYPIFLLIVIKTLGLLAVPLMQGLLIGIGAVLLWRIGRIVSNGVGLTAALLFSFDPAGIVYANLVVTEPLFLFFVLWMVYMMVYNADSLFRGVIMPGFLLGMATMVRPVGEVFLLACVMFYFFSPKVSWQQFFKKSILFSCAFFIVVGPWIIRNKILFDSTELSAVASWQVYHSHAPHFYAYKNGIAEREAERLFQERLEAIDPFKEDVRIGKVGSLRHAPYMWRIGLDYIRQYPLQFGLFHIAKTSPFFISDGLRQIARDIKLHAVPGVNLGSLALRGNAKGLFNALTKDPTTLVLFSVGFLFWLGVNIVMVIGSAALIRSSNGVLRALALSFLLAILLTALVAGGAVAHPRYRYSVSAFMFLLAATGLSQIRARLRTLTFRHV